MDPNLPHPTVDRDGRTFLAPAPSVPVVYPLPVDVEKLDTYDGLHFLIKDVVGSNYFFEANVKHALAADLHRTKLAVDLGCGTGAWLREMAEEFPNAHFIGVDIVDSWDRLEDELDNIEYVIDDIKGRTRFADNTFDLVHIRHMRLTVVDFSALINEVARILRPGGLLLSEEWSSSSVVDNVELELRDYVPGLAELNDLLAEVIQRNGPHALAEEVIPLIQASGCFVDEHYVVQTFYYGQRQAKDHDSAVGYALSKQLVAHVEGLRHLLRRLRTDEQLYELQAIVAEELDTKSGIMCCYYMSMARKDGE